MLLPSHCHAFSASGKTAESLRAFVNRAFIERVRARALLAELQRSISDAFSVQSCTRLSHFIHVT